MINTVLELLNQPELHLGINLVTHVVVFLGAFYVAMFNRRLPVWHVTPIWYIGLASLLTVITIVLELIFGMTFPLSHFNMALFSEAILDISLAYLVVMMFVGTARQNRQT